MRVYFGKILYTVAPDRPDGKIPGEIYTYAHLYYMSDLAEPEIIQKAIRDDLLITAGGGKSARTVRSAEFEIQKLQTAEEVKHYVEQHGV